MSNTIPAALESAFAACPKCQTDEAWHPCTTEDGSTRYACDRCGWSLAVRLPEPPKPTKIKRPLKLEISIEHGSLVVETGRGHVLSFCPGRYLAIGDSWELVSAAESDDREQQASEVGREVGRRNAEEAHKRDAMASR